MFTFRRQSLGTQGIRYLFAYLQGEGFKLKLDVGASKALAEIQGGRKVLDQSRRAGLGLKQKRKSSLRIQNFKRRLKPFQVPATAHMIAVSHPANFSVPGSGKTTIALAAFTDLKNANTVNVLVVVGPRSSFAPWEREAKACLSKKTKIVRVSGTKAQRLQAWRHAVHATVVILNYQVAANDLENLKGLLAERSAMLVVDESHYIKSIADGKWTTTMREIAPLAVKRVILSGTPAPNSLTDLWARRVNLAGEVVVQDLLDAL